MRSHYCGDLRPAQIGEQLSLCGWVHRRRDHGGVIFIDLRDRSGLIQLVFDPDQAETFALAERLRSEFVIGVHGRLRARPDGTLNAEMPTGEVEVLAADLIIFNPAKTPPFPLDEYHASGGSAGRSSRRSPWFVV